MSPNQGYVDMPLTVGCGQCIGCRLDRSRGWGIRAMHEAKLHPYNSFLTLTYNNSSLPPHRSLRHEDWQKFIKKLRFHMADPDSLNYEHLLSETRKARYLMCGEYGENFGRPHYHACVFDLDFKDKWLWKIKNGQKLYRSPTLEKIWTLGHSSIGTVTFESAAYVARYVTKKITGKNALHHYNEIDPATGEILSERKTEYSQPSRNPGLAKGFYEKYKDDIFPDDFVLLRGKKLKVPRYYNTQYEIEYPGEFEKIKNRRLRAAEQDSANNSRDRLDVREEIQTLKFKKLKRTLK